MVDGVARVVGDADLAAIVNTGDDADFYGLRVCPDLDICTYVLAGTIDPRGWGFERRLVSMPRGARHVRPGVLVRPGRPRPGHAHLPDAAPQAGGAGCMRSPGRSAPRSASRRGSCRCPTTRSARGSRPGTACVSFQEYLVKGGARDEITQIAFDGMEDARPAPGVLEAIARRGGDRASPRRARWSRSERSSPFPASARRVAARRERLHRRQPDRRAQARRGPGAQVPGRGRLPGVLGDPDGHAVRGCVGDLRARRRATRRKSPPIEALGVRAVATDILMPDRPQRQRLADEVLAGGRRAMTAAAVIPVKPIDRALGRLASVLSPGERRELQAAMLLDLLDACRQSSARWPRRSW